VARVILINGAPGAGKSTIAHLLAERRRLTLALDVDNIKHALGQWDVGWPQDSNLQVAQATTWPHARLA
jgi:adenylate kinase family enzyme